MTDKSVKKVKRVKKVKHKRLNIIGWLVSVPNKMRKAKNEIIFGLGLSLSIISVIGWGVSIPTTDYKSSVVMLVGLTIGIYLMDTSA